MEKSYDSQKYEEEIYKKWEASGALTPTNKKDPKAKTFSIIMPPPNANDPLHLGHAMFVSLEDILIRFHRMLGESTLWLPGVDHAGIETQFVFEKKLAKDGKSRFDFDRTTLYEKIWQYVEENSGIAVKQMKRLGSSADWSRFTFTLDPKVVDFVYDTFIKLHNDSLVYRDEKLVNYCVKCGTGYSELEIEYEERVDPLYYIRYPLHGAETEFVTVATVRPEPIFADTHLAVNGKDKTKEHLIGKQVINPLTGSLMDIIADDYVDPEFGTGVVKLTPAHDANDFEVAIRHGLPINTAITMWGKLADSAGPWAGLKVSEARRQIVEFLVAKGLVEKVNDKYSHRVATCYRCHSIIEPLPLPQFFVSVQSLTKKALQAIKEGKVKIHGAGREKILVNWLSNLRDWNISRQIVWGIRLPIWYEASSNPKISVTFLTKSGEKVRGEIGSLLETYETSEIKAGLQALIAPKDATYTVSKAAPSMDYIQETDTFDTWFSSGQWPVATLKIREGDFDQFYPTNVMETGYDILPFWVMRMLLLGLYLTDEVPFKDVYLHGLIRDDKGRKMSKSIGNVINPIDMVEKYGADAIRMALVMSSTPGQDKSVGEQTIKGMRNFSNKVWNACRFVKEFGQSAAHNQELDKSVQMWVDETTKHLDNLRIGQASEYIYNAFWHEFCDRWIEEAKEGKVSAEQMRATLLTVLTLLHPFAPFVTEACYSEMFAKNPQDLLINQTWPTVLT